MELLADPIKFHQVLETAKSLQKLQIWMNNLSRAMTKIVLSSQLLLFNLGAVGANPNQRVGSDIDHHIWHRIMKTVIFSISLNSLHYAFLRLYLPSKNSAVPFQPSMKYSGWSGLFCREYSLTAVSFEISLCIYTRKHKLL
jgi:hypothetical protein